MACDGDIAAEEVDLLKNYVSESQLFGGLDVESLLNGYIASINAVGISFLNSCLKELRDCEMTVEQQLTLIRIAIAMIEADNVIQYSEVKFFKRLRQCLPVTDDVILSAMPDKEDYLLPDIAQQEYEFILPTQFSGIRLDVK